MTDTTTYAAQKTKQKDLTTRAWVALVVLSLVSALATLDGLPPKIAGLFILGLALLKAWIILARYLGLAAAPGWLHGLFSIIVLWAAIIGGLYLI